MNIGTIVHYVRADGPEAAHGTCVPALVVGLHPGATCDLAVMDARTESVRWELRERVPQMAAHRFGSFHPA